MKAAHKRTWKDLARERIEDTTPTIPLGRTFWPLSDEERESVVALFATDADPAQLVEPAELGEAVKNQISHRAQALRALLQRLSR